jgi:hypothetical protein
MARQGLEHTVSPQEKRAIVDHVESEALKDDDVELILCEGAWCCACNEGTERWAVADAEHPLKFAVCFECNAAALVTIWGT